MIFWGLRNDHKFVKRHEQELELELEWTRHFSSFKTILYCFLELQLRKSKVGSFISFIYGSLFQLHFHYSVVLLTISTAFLFVIKIGNWMLGIIQGGSLA